MDEENLHLIKQLLTRIGATMEDASVVALVWQEDQSLTLRLEKVKRAACTILALTEAAQALASDAA
jgi:hypothetical protein